MSSSAHLDTWKTYQSAWGPIDDDRRRELLHESVADDIEYSDPASRAHGIDELVARIERSQETFAGAYFENDSFLEHHDQGLFQWTMYDGNGDEFVKGSSFARFGEDGRLEQATGFFRTPSK